MCLILSGERVNVFLNIENNARCPFLPILFNIVLASGINPPHHQNKTILIGKKEQNLSLFTEEHDPIRRNSQGMTNFFCDVCRGGWDTASHCLLIVSYSPLESSLCPLQHQKHWLTETHLRSLYQANTAGGGGASCPQLPHRVPHWKRGPI